MAREELKSMFVVYVRWTIKGHCSLPLARVGFIDASVISFVLIHVLIDRIVIRGSARLQYWRKGCLFSYRVYCVCLRCPLVVWSAKECNANEDVPAVSGVLFHRVYLNAVVHMRCKSVVLHAYKSGWRSIISVGQPVAKTQIGYHHPRSQPPRLMARR